MVLGVNVDVAASPFTKLPAVAIPQKTEIEPPECRIVPALWNQQSIVERGDQTRGRLTILQLEDEGLYDEAAAAQSWSILCL